MFTFGGDPEVFLELNGKFVSAEDENGLSYPAPRKNHTRLREVLYRLTVLLASSTSTRPRTTTSL
jgi:hypothetical protein